MRKFANRNSWLVGLTGTTAIALALAACDSRGVPTAPARPGAERAASAGGLTATAPGRQYDNDARATDETRAGAIGSQVAGRGGQRAQREAQEREAAERDRAAREVAQREAAQREATRAATPPTTQTAAPPRATATTTATPPPATVTTAAAPPPQPAPAAPPATTATTTATPPPQTAAAPAVPATPPRPQDPNKAFEPPPGWVPPGRTEAVNQAQPAPAAQTAAAAPRPAATPAPAPTPAPTITTSPVAPPQAEQRAPEPPRTASAMPAPSPTPAPPPRAVPPPSPTVTTTAVAPAPAPAPAVQPPAPVQMANLATATSGAVPPGVTVSPPLGGPLQVAVIQFGRNSSGLSGDDVQVLRSVADIHRRNGGTVRVLGHASRDVSGTSVADIRNGNLNLSIKRAEAVSALLVRYGVPAEAIVVEGVSDEEPVYETRTARGVAANRRAEVFIDF